MSWLAGARLLHLSGITPALGPSAAAATLAEARAAKPHGVPISFGGNYRAMLWEAWDSDSRGILAQLISIADLFFGNHRDLSLVLGKVFGRDGEHHQREATKRASTLFQT